MGNGRCKEEQSRQADALEPAAAPRRNQVCEGDHAMQIDVGSTAVLLLLYYVH